MQAQGDMGVPSQTYRCIRRPPTAGIHIERAIPQPSGPAATALLVAPSERQPPRQPRGRPRPGRRPGGGRAGGSKLVRAALSSILIERTPELALEVVVC